MVDAHPNTTEVTNQEKIKNSTETSTETLRKGKKFTLGEIAMTHRYRTNEIAMTHFKGLSYLMRLEPIFQSSYQPNGPIYQISSYQGYQKILIKILI